MSPARLALLAASILHSSLMGSESNAAAVPQVMIITNHFTAPKDQSISARLVVSASNIEIDGNGATLLGPGEAGDPRTLENAGVGILLEGVTGVTLRNFRVRGFSIGLLMRHAEAVLVKNCDFSDNYDNPKHGWDELPPRGGIRGEWASRCVIVGNRANRVWDGVSLFESDDNLISDNNFSHCSNTGAKLWKSSRNRFLHNDLSYGIRIDRAAGEVHARDSTGALIETGSDDNFWWSNDITNGGDGIFIRPLNRWVSRGNIFIENDTSWANNNCIESWSPGNTFIRNKANHGSYGFWLGGSDQTVLIGNEAAFNGLTNGNHNAPEPGFGHGGIVLVGGPSSHTRIEGNYLHDNNGAGLAFRGDTASKGRDWQTEHWVVQGNRVVSNRFGIWGRWGRGITLAANVFEGNAQSNFVQDVTGWFELPSTQATRTAPFARLRGPSVALVNDEVEFDASESLDPNASANALGFQWAIDEIRSQGSIWRHTFQQPGFHRINLTVDNGAMASLAWKELIVLPKEVHELGTEGNAREWGFELENDPNHEGKIQFTDDADALVGVHSIRFTPSPYPGAYATAIFPAKRNATWDFTGKQHLRFWIKTRNPNIPGFQNAGPVLKLFSSSGSIELKPVKDRNLLNDPPHSEARWSWMPVEVPLSESAEWSKTFQGEPNLSTVNAISLALDSWGGDSFTIWIDGLSVE